MPGDEKRRALALLGRMTPIIVWMIGGILYAYALSWMGTAVNEADPLIFTHILIADSPFGLGVFLWPLVGAGLAFRDRRPVRLAVYAGLFAHYGWLAVTLSSGALSAEAQFPWAASNGPVASIPALSFYLAGQVLVWVALARGAAGDCSQAGVRLKGRWDALVGRIKPARNVPSWDEPTDYRFRDARGAEIAIDTYRQLALFVRTGHLTPSTEVFDPGRSAWVTAGEVEGLRPFLAGAQSFDLTKERSAASGGRGNARTAAMSGRWSAVHIRCVFLCIAAVAGVFLCRWLQPDFLGDHGFSLELTLVAAFFAAVLAFVVSRFGRERWPWIGIATFTAVFATTVFLHIGSVANGVRTARNTAAFFERTGGDAAAAEGERITWWKYGSWRTVVEGTVLLDRESRRLLDLLLAGYESEFQKLGTDDPLSPKIISTTAWRTTAIEAMTRLRDLVGDIEQQNLAVHGEFLRRLDSADLPDWIVRSSESSNRTGGRALGDIGPELIENHKLWIELTLEALEFLQAEEGRYYFNRGRPIFASGNKAADFNSMVSRVASARSTVDLSTVGTKRATISIDPEFRDEDTQPLRVKTPIFKYSRPSFERRQRALKSELKKEIKENEYELCVKHCFSENCAVNDLRIVESSPEEVRLDVYMRCVDEVFTVTEFMSRSGERWILEH